MTLRALDRAVLVLGWTLAGCGSMSTPETDGDGGDARGGAAVEDVASERGAIVDRDTGAVSDASDGGDAAMEASIDGATRDAGDAAIAADASANSGADACVADGGDRSLRFSVVYRQTINDGSATTCTTSSRCHGRPGEFFDLSTESAAYASLVGVMGSCGVRVTPCDLSASYLSQLMHRPDTCRGMRHTGFGQTMSPAQVAILDAWILGGAQR